MNDTFFPMTTPERIELGNQLFNFLGPILNRVHKVSYSDRFWRIILSPYVTTVNTRRKFFNSSDLKSIPGVYPINSHNKPTFREETVTKLKYLGKAIKTRESLKILNKTLEANENIAFGFHDQLSVMEDIPAFLPTYYPLLLKGKKRSLRLLVKQIANEQSSLFEKNVIRQLPAGYVEYFDYNMSLVNLYNPKNKTFNVSMLENPFMRFLLAKYIERGAKLNYYQHGAFYGEYKYYSPYSYEYSIADQYFTWGWKIDEKNVPWKSYRLNRFMRSYKTISSCERTYDCLIVFPLINKQSFTDFKINTSYLINNLDPNLFKTILIRPRSSATDLKYDEQFKFIKDARVTIDSGKTKISNLVASSGIVVQYSYPSTNFLECLYVDHPSVVILTNDQPTDLVKPFYDYFIKSGVFHFNFTSMVNHLNSIDIDNWWAGITSDKLYKEFKNTFLRQ